MPLLPSYRNQLIDLLCKSVDWFLYEGNTGTSFLFQVTSFVIFDNFDDLERGCWSLERDSTVKTLKRLVSSKGHTCSNKPFTTPSGLFKRVWTLIRHQALKGLKQDQWYNYISSGRVLASMSSVYRVRKSRMGNALGRLLLFLFFGAVHSSYFKNLLNYPWIVLLCMFKNYEILSSGFDWFFYTLLGIKCRLKWVSTYIQS